jgi:hypothetical protein
MNRRLILATLCMLALLTLIAVQARGAALIDVNGWKVLILTVDEYNAAILRAQADIASKAKAAKCDTI